MLPTSQRRVHANSRTESTEPLNDLHGFLLAAPQQTLQQQPQQTLQQQKAMHKLANPEMLLMGSQRP